MKAFSHTNAKTLAEASTALGGGEAEMIAGGTDLIGRLKDNILPTYPTALINIKTIPGLDYIKEEGGALKIGATTRLADIAAHPVIQQKYTALAQAAGRVAAPHVRDMATLGGNINQLHRCWYFRKPENRFDDCVHKGRETCYAMMRDNRYHSILGPTNRCMAVHPSDTAPALIALNATIVTTKRRIIAEEFWDVKFPESTVKDGKISYPASTGYIVYDSRMLPGTTSISCRHCHQRRRPDLAHPQSSSSNSSSRSHKEGEERWRADTREKY
jgi:xanthine dehydrogenase YagS FAD-binding subunit